MRYQCVGKCPVWWRVLNPGSQVNFSTMIKALKVQAAAGVDQGSPLLHAKKNLGSFPTSRWSNPSFSVYEDKTRQCKENSLHEELNVTFSSSLLR